MYIHIMPGTYKRNNFPSDWIPLKFNLETKQIKNFKGCPE